MDNIIIVLCTYSKQYGTRDTVRYVQLIIEIALLKYVMWRRNASASYHSNACIA